MPLFRLRHPDPGFKGTAGGVDFSAGAGTTSALSYVHGLVRAIKCRAFVISDGKEDEIEILEELNKGGAMVISFRVREKVKDEGVVESAPSLPSPEPSPVPPEKPAARRGRHRK